MDPKSVPGQVVISREEERAALFPELVEALSGLLGPSDDPRLGWRGHHDGDPMQFECEYCRVRHEDCTLLPHTATCATTVARALLAKAEALS